MWTLKRFVMWMFFCPAFRAPEWDNILRVVMKHRWKGAKVHGALVLLHVGLIADFSWTFHAMLALSIRVTQLFHYVTRKAEEDANGWSMWTVKLNDKVLVGLYHFRLLGHNGILRAPGTMLRDADTMQHHDIIGTLAFQLLLNEEAIVVWAYTWQLAGDFTLLTSDRVHVLYLLPGGEAVGAHALIPPLMVPMA